MIRIVLLVLIAALVTSGWAWAREQEMLNHNAEVHLQEMENAYCTPSSSTSAGGG